MERQNLIITIVVVGVLLALAAADILWTIYGPCRTDLMLMMDDSGSIPDQDFNKVKTFILDLANNENIKDQLDKGNIEIGTATFSQCPKWMSQESCESQYGVKFVSNSYTLKQTVKGYERMGGSTDIIKALEFVDSQMLLSARSNTDKMLLFMTDGKSADSNGNPQDFGVIKSVAENLKNKGVKVFAIAVGESDADFNQNELEIISSATCEKDGADNARVCKNSDQFIIKVDNFDGLGKIVDDLAEQVCEHQYWMAAIPIALAIAFVVLRIWLDRREASSLEKDAKELTTFTPANQAV